MKTGLCVALLCALLGAQEEAPKPLERGFEEGKYVDEYFGLVYQQKGMKEGFSLGGPTTLFTGSCPGGIEVEVSVGETPTVVTAAEVRKRALEAWANDGKKRTDLESGTGPLPWVLFVEKSLAGFDRHHGYAFYTRGFQVFQVHAQVRERSETSGEAIKAALGALRLDGESESFVLAHVVAKRSHVEPTDPKVLAQVGGAYLQEQLQNPALALLASKLALETAEPGTFTGDEIWQITSSVGMALLLLGRAEESIPTWEGLIELSKKTANPGDLGSNSHYNLACAYSLLGRLDEAFASLTKSLSMGSETQRGGLSSHAQTDPDLANMRKDPRWVELFETK